MPNVLFLDDDETRCKRALSALPYATIVTTAAGAIAELSKDPAKVWDVVMLDHDLGGQVMVESGREDCGMEVVRWMVVNKPQVETCLIHSFNAAAAHEMDRKLYEAGYKVFRAHYTTHYLASVAKALEGKKANET